MTFKVNLVVEGVDILSDDFDESPASQIADVHWRTTGGVTLAVLYTDGDPVIEACTFSRRLENTGAGRVVRVFDDFVNMSEIAHHLNVTRQTVRNWVDGDRGPGGFPQPWHSHGQHGDKGPMKVWRWAEVNTWLANIGLDDDLNYLTYAQQVEVESHLLRLEEPVGSAWTHANKKDDGAAMRALLETLVRDALADGDTSMPGERLGSLGIVVLSGELDFHRALSKESIYRAPRQLGSKVGEYE